MIVQEGDSPKKTKEKWVHEAIEQYRGGRYEETLASCEQALRLKNNYSRAHHGKGLALMGLEHYEEAVTSLEQAIRLSRQDGVDLDHLAKMYVDQGRALSRSSAPCSYRQENPGGEGYGSFRVGKSV